MLQRKSSSGEGAGGGDGLECSADAVDCRAPLFYEGKQNRSGRTDCHPTQCTVTRERTTEIHGHVCG